MQKNERETHIRLDHGWGIFLCATFYVSWKQQNELQQWLERTLWGISPEGIPPAKYPNMRMEIEALKAIIHIEEP